MRPIQLDYAAPAVASALGVAVLLVACLCAAMLWQYTSTLQQQTAHMQSALNQAKRTAGLAQPMLQLRPPASASSVADMQQAKQVAAFLLLPWNELFNALEAASLNDVVLLSIEPDAKKQQLNIIAEAKNKDSLFRYIQQMEATPQLSRVYLLKHEIVQDTGLPSAPQQPMVELDTAQQSIRFVITANWKKTL